MDSIGKSIRHVLLKQNLKSYSFDYPIKYIAPKNIDPIILTYEILLNVLFDSSFGFKFSYEDLPIETQSIKFEDGLNNFYIQFLEFIKILNTSEKNIKQEEHWNTIKKIVMNPDNIQ